MGTRGTVGRPTGSVVGAHVQGDGQSGLGRHAGAGRVQGQFADGDPHAVDAEIAQAKDAFAVGNDDEAYILFRPVAEDVADAPDTIDRKVKAPRTPQMWANC